MDQVDQDIPEDVDITDKEDEVIMDVAMDEEDSDEGDHLVDMADLAEEECRRKVTEEDLQVVNGAGMGVVIHHVAMDRTT